MFKNHSNKNNKGFLISFEGIEGVGKSTQVQLITEYLTAKKIPCIKTREPGGTSVGNQIRSCLFSEHDFPLHPETELCLLLGARFDHWNNIVLPALNDNNVVIIDRFIDATMAYQGYGRGLDRDQISSMHKSLKLDIEPDLTFLLDMPIEASRDRMNTRGFSDRIEKEKNDFFDKVRQGYLNLSQLHNRIHQIDASLSKDIVSNMIIEKTNLLLNIQ